MHDGIGRMVHPPDGEPPKMEPPGWRTPPPPGWRTPPDRGTPPGGETPRMEEPPTPWIQKFYILTA